MAGEKILVMTERPSIEDELKNLNSLICAMNISAMAKHEMLISVRNIHRELDKKTEAARNWERIAKMVHNTSLSGDSPLEATVIRQ